MPRNLLFSKKELVSLAVIFTVLIAVFTPNLFASLRRARDQVRRDDLGVMIRYLDEYFAELGVFPPSSDIGEIMDCLKPGDSPYQDSKGNWIIDPIPCVWGKDTFANLITGKTYISILPRDPRWEDGRTYFYLSNGSSYQIFASLEGKNEPEYSDNVIQMGIKCGSVVCNMGRSYSCDIPKSLEECEKEAADLINKQ